MGADRGNSDRVGGVSPAGVLHGQYAKSSSGAGLQQNGILQPPELLEGVVEPGSMIGMHGPIGWTDRVTPRNPSARDV